MKHIDSNAQIFRPPNARLNVLIPLIVGVVWLIALMALFIDDSTNTAGLLIAGGVMTVMWLLMLVFSVWKYSIHFLAISPEGIEHRAPDVHLYVQWDDLDYISDEDLQQRMRGYRYHKKYTVIHLKKRVIKTSDGLRKRIIPLSDFAPSQEIKDLIQQYAPQLFK